LGALTLPITQDVGIDDLAVAREKVFHDVSSLRPTLKRNNIKEMMKFSPEETVDITNFFFDEVMGRATLGRVPSIVRNYKGRTEMEVDVGAGAHAEQFASSPEEPEIYPRVLSLIFPCLEDPEQQGQPVRGGAADGLERRVAERV